MAEFESIIGPDFVLSSLEIERPSKREIYGAMVWEDAHSDWRAGILYRARPQDVADVKKILSEGKPAPEITLFVRPEP